MKKLFKMATVAVLSVALLAGCGAQTASKDAETIKIGGNFELTGGVAEFGKKGENGAKLAIKQANEKGGVLGKQIEYKGADNKSDAGESTSATLKLATEDKVVGIVGPMTSGNTKAAIQIVTDNKIPLVTPTGTNTALTVTEDGKLNPWIYRACFIDPFQGEVAANFAMDTLGAKKAAIMTDQKSDYSKGLADSFKATITKNGGSVVAEEQFVAQQDKDFRAILTRIKAQNPDVVFVPAYYEEVALIIKQARDMDMKQAFVGGDGWGSGPMVEFASADALNNTYYVDHVAADDPSVAEFVSAYKAEYNTEPDSFAILGYDAAKMLIAGIEKAGSTDGEAIRKALENLSGFEALSGQINVDPATHNPKKSATILEFKDGQKVFKTKVDPK